MLRLKTDFEVIEEVARSNSGAASREETSEQRTSKHGSKTLSKEKPKYYQDAKGNLRRAYTRFSSPPLPRPNTVCFSCPYLELDHAQVLRMVRRRLNILKGKEKLMIQHQPRNVINGAGGLADRWLVTVQTADAKTELLRGLHVDEKSYAVSRYDDVVQREYRKFLRLSQMTTEVLALGRTKLDDKP